MIAPNNSAAKEDSIEIDLTFDTEEKNSGNNGAAAAATTSESERSSDRTNNGACGTSHPMTNSVRLRRQMSKKPSFYVEENDEISPILILDKDDQEILPEDIAVPPDGGYGWVIVFAAFMTSVILMGNSSSTFSVILEAIVGATQNATATAHAQISVSSIAAVSACNGACSQFAGPFAAALANKAGFRTTAIIGSCLASASFAISWYFCQSGAPNITILFIFYGIIGGIGVGFVLIPSAVIVGFYFERKRALATGIVYCGNGIGVIAFPPILAALIHHFGWPGTILIQGGILLICALIAILYRPLDAGKNSLAEAESQVDLIPATEPTITNNGPSNRMQDDEVQVCSIPEVPPKIGGVKAKRLKFQRSSQVSEDLSQIQEDNESNGSSVHSREQIRESVVDHVSSEKPPAAAARNKFVRLQSLGYMSGAGTGGKRGSISTSSPNILRRRISVALSVADHELHEPRLRILRVDSKKVFNRPMNRDNIFFCGSIDQIQEQPQDVANMDILFANSKWEQDSDAEETPGGAGVQVKVEQNAPEIPTTSVDWKSKLYVVHKMLGLELFKSPTFLVLCGMCTFNTIGLVVPFLYLKGLAQERGYEPKDATFLISVIGIADTCGRILAGILATTCGNRSIFICNLAMTVGGIATILAPLSTSYWLFALYACTFGFCNATVSSLRTIVLVELLGLSKLTNAYGLTLCFKGLAQFCGAPLAGLIRDLSGTYDASFYLAGTFILCAGVLCYPIRRVKNWEEKRAKITTT